MIISRLIPSSCYLAVVLLLHIARSLAQPGQLAFFLDASCNQPSLALPTASLDLSTCLVLVGAYGLVTTAYPACPNGGTARIIMYKDTICAQSTKGFLQNKCSWYFATLPIPSVMFTCEDEGSEPRPTSTVTAAVSRIAGVATTNGEASSMTMKMTGPVMSLGSLTSTMTTTTTPPAGSAASPTLASEGAADAQSTESKTKTPGPSGSATSSDSPDMSTSDKIAIGVGIGIGIPTLLIGVVGLLIMLGWRPRCCACCS